MIDRDKYPSELAERFQVRMPAGLRDRIAEAAKQNGRSMNAEILAVLEQRFPAPQPHEELLKTIEDALTLANSSGNSAEFVAILNQFKQTLEALDEETITAISPRTDI